MIDQIPPVSLLPPAADAAGRTSANWLDLRNCVGKAYLKCRVNQGNAATVLWTPLQATSVAGAGSKAIAAMPIFLNAATATSDAYVQQASAANFTTSATLADKIIVFEITPEMCLDMVNGFRFVGVSTGASNAANITEAELYILQAIQGASAPSTYV
jgi:hypothetical protein